MDLSTLINDPVRVLEPPVKLALIDRLTLLEANARAAREKLCTGEVLMGKSEGIDVAPEGVLVRLGNGHAGRSVQTPKDQTRRQALATLQQAIAGCINAANMGSEVGQILEDVSGGGETIA
jgi:hypothetical protein